jgi:Zn-dependent M28 family amino/carboxypeptidase
MPAIALPLVGLALVQAVTPPPDHDPRLHEIVNVLAVQRGQRYPDRYVLITGHYDSRASDGLDAVSDAPGANDDASGTAAVIESARLLSRYRFDKAIVYAALAGEEQGLWGGQQLARHAKERGWIIEGVLNNDIIGNTEGIGGHADNLTVRVFSEPVAATESEAERRARRVDFGYAARGSTAVTWQAAAGPVAAYRVYWRDTIEPFWTHSRFVAHATDLALEGVIIDDHLVGVASVGPDGNESVVAFAGAGR